MVAAFDYCLHGRGGAARRSTPPCTAWSTAAHVDHLHPDSGIALATAADGERLTAECFGDRVVWVPWRRPGFQLGLDIAAIAAEEPAGDRVHPGRPRHHGLGRYECAVRGPIAGDHPARPRASSPQRGRADPFGAVLPGYAALPEASPAVAGRGPGPADPGAGLDRPPAGRALHRLRRRARLPRPGPSIPRSPRSAPRARITSCGPRCARSSSTCRRTHRWRTSRSGCANCTPTYRADYAAYYDRHAVADQPGDAGRRSGDRARPGRRACSASAPTSRPRGSPASSTSTRST